jgi:hypothetical protein
MFSNMSFHMFITEMFSTFCACRSSHTYISTSIKLTRSRSVRHFYNHPYLILLIKVSNQRHFPKLHEKLIRCKIISTRLTPIQVADLIEIVANTMIYNVKRNLDEFIRQVGEKRLSRQLLSSYNCIIIHLL